MRMIIIIFDNDNNYLDSPMNVFDWSREIVPGLDGSKEVNAW